MLLKNKNIQLRALELKDAEYLYLWENNTENWLINDQQTPISKSLLLEFIQSNQDIYTQKQLRLMITLNSTSEIIGCIDLFAVDFKNSKCGIGIYITEEHRSKGNGNLALQSIINYTFEVLHLKQIYAHVPINNTKSITLFSKNNFKCNGVLKSWIKDKKEQFVDVCFLQLIKA
jgi:diamine N-acetyltransferase